MDNLPTEIEGMEVIWYTDDLYPSLIPIVASVRAKLSARLGAFIGKGLSREVYVSERYVYKLPYTDKGINDNYYEARICKQSISRCAPCRVIHIQDIPILVMERLDLKLSKEEIPEWADWIDCRQVGRSRSGKILAYDFA